MTNIKETILTEENLYPLLKGNIGLRSPYDVMIDILHIIENFNWSDCSGIQFIKVHPKFKLYEFYHCFGVDKYVYELINNKWEETKLRQ